MAEVITLGETMVCFSPDVVAPLCYVNNYHPRIAGAESNLAIGLDKMGHSVSWISRLGDDEFGWIIHNKLRGEGVDTSGICFDVEAQTGIMFKECTGGETKMQKFFMLRELLLFYQKIVKQLSIKH